MNKKIVLISLLILSFVGANAQKTRLVKNYYPNGNLMESGRMVDDSKKGMWVYYNEKGWLERKENWKNGERRWTLIYNEKNRKVKWIYADGTEKLYKGCNCKN